MSKNLKIELYHDILARRIYERASREDKLRLQLERLVRDKHHFYREEKGGLLTRDELTLIQTYVGAENLPGEQQEYIQISREAIEAEEKAELLRLQKEKDLLEQRRQQQRKILIGTIVFAVALAVLGFWALTQKWEADRQKTRAEEQKKEADIQRDNAQKYADSIKIVNKQVIEARDTAEAAQQRAETNARLAVQEKNRAEKNYGLALSAEKKERQARTAAEQQATAYRLLVLASEIRQRSPDSLPKAIQIARRAAGIAGDSTIYDFLRNSFNALPSADKQRWGCEADFRLNGAALHPAGGVMLAYGRDGLLRCQSPGNAAAFASPAPVADAAWSPDGRRFLTAEGNRAVLRDAASGIAIREFPHPAAVRIVRFFPDGQRLATVADDNSAYLWRIDATEPFARLTHQKRIDALDISADGRWVATAGRDNTAKVWSGEGTLQQTLSHSTYVSRAVFSPDGQLLLTATIDFSIRLWSWRQNQVKATVKHEGAVNSLVFSRDGQTFLTASNDEKARLWDLRGRSLLILPHDTAPEVSNFVTQAFFSPDEQYLVTTTGAQLFIWNRAGFRLAELDAGSKVLTAGYSPDGRTLFSAAEQGQLLAWRSYSAFIESLPEVDLIAIHKAATGFLMPIGYWTAETDPAKLLKYAFHWMKESDTFDPPAEQVRVLGNAAALFEKRAQVLPLGKWEETARKDRSNVLCSLAWYQLLTRDFRGAEASAQQGLSIYPANEWIRGNLALTYVLTGRYKQAATILRELKDRTMEVSPGFRRPFKDILRQDLSTLEEKGITHPDFARVRRLLAQ